MPNKVHPDEGLVIIVYEYFKLFFSQQKLHMISQNLNLISDQKVKWDRLINVNTTKKFYIIIYSFTIYKNYINLKNCSSFFSLYTSCENN